MGGDVAQMGERLLCTEEVTGSSPVISTKPEPPRTLTASRALVIMKDRRMEADARGRMGVRRRGPAAIRWRAEKGLVKGPGGEARGAP